ncbi:hypothetical protein PIB30_058179 [Stylosanthes scabra]|uniref:F-box domain-containing protein n=1 Tax=Stylosanthes scabra TaxID=79078 RepID=A0ABU6UM99_9FABA|nr:hypothetical protein [Stylosanthes scabra]
MKYQFLKTTLPLSICWKWIVEFIQSLFGSSHSSSSLPPTLPRPIVLCNDVIFDIFLHLPPQALPRFSCLNKQSNSMINSPLFQTMYWNQKLRLPHLSAIVYYQRKLNNRIGFALTIKDYDKRMDKSEFHKHRQVPQFRFPSKSYTRLLQWAESMLQHHEMGVNGNQRDQNCNLKNIEM